MSENLRIYNNVREVPKEALKEIQAGRLKGKSDINPMWRIKALTEQFGVVGVGWKLVIVDKRMEAAPNGEIATFVDIELYIKDNGVWSEAIPGTGGSSFVANEKNGPYVSDECFKMAFTDAISVACKLLGFGANVYWEKDKSKYDKAPIDTEEEELLRKQKEEEERLLNQPISKDKVDTIESLLTQTNTNKAKLLERYKINSIEEMTNAIFVKAIKALESTLNNQNIVCSHPEEHQSKKEAMEPKNGPDSRKVTVVTCNLCGAERIRA